MGLLDRPDGKTLIVIFVICALGLLALAATAIRARMASRPSRWTPGDEDAAYPTEPAAALTSAAPAVQVIEPPVQEPVAESKPTTPRKRTPARKTTATKKATPRSTTAKRRP